MLNQFARAFFTKLFTPVARLLLKLGISPDIVTIVGTVGVCFGALAFYPRHEFFWGTIVITVFVFSDTVDGVMARMSGRSSSWGAYLDSTLDRVGDSAIFGGLVLYYAGRGGQLSMAGLALACLILGSVVSYAKARAEGLGMTANVGIAERADRLVAVLAATGLVGLGVPEILLTVVLCAAGGRQPGHRGPAHARGAAPGPRGGVSALAERAALVAYRAGWFAVRRVPGRVAYRAFDLIADVSWRRGGRSVQRLRSNYARVRPELGPGRARRPGPRGHALLPALLVRRVPAAGRGPAGAGAQTIRTEGDGPVREQLATGRRRHLLPRPPGQLGHRRRLGHHPARRR